MARNLADHGRGEKSLIASCKSSSPKTLTLLRLAVDPPSPGFGGEHTAAITFRVKRSLA